MSEVNHCPPSQYARSSFCFLYDSQAQRLSTRYKELEQSKARAHAAHIAWQKRKRGKAKLVTKNVRHKEPVSLDVLVSAKFLQKLEASSQRLDSGEELQISFERSPKGDCWSCRNSAACCDCNHKKRKIKKQKDINEVWHSIASDEIPSPSPGFGCFRDEQFAGLPDGSDDYARGILDFHFQTLSSWSHLATDLFNISDLWTLYTPLLRYPLIYHASLILTGSLLGRIRNQPDDRDSLRLLYHKGQAMRLIRTQMNCPGWQRTNQRNGLATAITFLAYFEFATGNSEHGAQHLKGLEMMIDQIGGLENLPVMDSCPEQLIVTFHRAMFAMAGWSDLKHETRRLLPTYPSLPLDAQIHKLLGIIPPGFHQIVMEGQLCIDTIHLLARAAFLEIDKSDTARQRARAARSRQARMYNGLIESCPILRMPNDTHAISIDKMICFALVTFCSSASHAVVPTIVAYAPSKMELKSRVQDFQPHTDAEQDCLVWLFFVAVNAHRPITKTGNMLTDEGLDLMRCFYAKFSELVCKKEWDDVERILARFFWTAEFSKSWRRSWVDLMAMVERT